MKTLFRCKVGSWAFGTNTVGSDEDVAEIYKCDVDDLLGMTYKEHDDVDKDNRRYEVGKFIKLLMNGNPNMLEILNIPEDCILETSEEWEQLIKPVKDKFLTKGLCGTFAGYAKTQIEKARGLNKKINWEGQKIERKGVIDFAMVLPYDSGDTVAITAAKWLEREGYTQEMCGLVGIDHFRYTYLLFVDELEWVKKTNHRYEGIETHHFRGIYKEGADDVHVSSVPKYCIPKAILYFNKDGYSTHCKDYASYEKWLRERNDVRYNTNKQHGQKYDSKNIMHVVRLLKTARDIAEKGCIIVRRSEEEIKYLLSIKSGEEDLGKLVDWAEVEYAALSQLFNESSLPENVDAEFCNQLLIKIRKYETGGM